VVDAEAVSARKPLLLYVTSGEDVQRSAVGPALAAAAERAGWAFECYYDTLRKGRHFGGGPVGAAREGWPGGSLVLGGRHLDQLLWLATTYEISVLGDPASPLWPALDAAGAQVVTRTHDLVELYEAGFAHLGETVPRSALVLDGSAQGRRELIVAPYLYPSFFLAAPALGLDVSTEARLVVKLKDLGVTDFHGLWLEAQRRRQFPARMASDEGDATDESYASLTAHLAERHETWGRGVLLGDPDLVAAQLPRARRLRLLPLYGLPQTEAIERRRELIRRAREPVFGRQYDDHDFFELARLGHGLNGVDPAPPFDALAEARHAFPRAPRALGAAEPTDAELREWAREGRVLVTLLVWAGMVRELDCLARMIDLSAETGAAMGLLVTTETLEHAAVAGLPLIATPRERGGVFGSIEVLLASTGRGVAAEAAMPDGALAPLLVDAAAAARELLPDELGPRGWWPLLDAELHPFPPPRLGWRESRPVVLLNPRTPADSDSDEAGGESRRRDLRGLVGAAIRGTALARFISQRRPFEGARPGHLDERVAQAACAAGFSYMWTKTRFGRPAIGFRDGDFVALSQTAGGWEGWSPFYTLRGRRDLTRAEARLLRAGRPGWLAGTIDSPLWAMSGEVLEHGCELYKMVEFAARGGSSGRLVNVVPHTVARYARVLADLGLVEDEKSLGGRRAHAFRHGPQLSRGLARCGTHGPVRRG
jgi:hypothetical protein